MKVLVVCPFVPWPVIGGNRVRIYNTLCELSTRHTVDFVCPAFREPLLTPEAKRQLNELCSNVYVAKQPNVHVPWRILLKVTSTGAYILEGTDEYEFYLNLRPFVETVRNLLTSNEYDVVLTNYWYTALHAVHTTGTPCICDTHDILSEIREREHLQKQGRLSLFWKRYMTRLRAKEAQALNCFDVVICVSERDRTYLRQNLRVSSPMEVFAHVRDRSPLKFSYSPDLDNVVLFFGSFRSPMNVDAVKVAAEVIFPLIQQQHRDARLVIAGSGGNHDVANLARHSSIEFIGYVEDIASMFHRAKVLLLPIRIGSGIKGRVLEAMEAGTPVVGSNIAAEGIGVQNGRTMFVADEPQVMADKVVQLLRNEKLRREMAMFARAFVEDRYSWSSTYGTIHKCLELAISHRRLQKCSW